jgi:hypothetical protein
VSKYTYDDIVSDVSGHDKYFPHFQAKPFLSVLIAIANELARIADKGKEELMPEDTLETATKSIELLQLRSLIKTANDDYEWKLGRANDAKVILDALKAKLAREEAND